MPSSLSERDGAAGADMLVNAQRAVDFVTGFTSSTFAADERTHFEVIRCLEIISEASRRLSAGTKARYSDVPWRQIAGAGNVYRHGYDSVTLDIVWLTVHDELPVLIAAGRAAPVRMSDP
ncbi:DUF86 domain-containing protein [Methylobacterium mesophilicum SR1.6/6]|uniref:DUF86 domain-containing protein n=1 Tax=Methylobacterium mesophilicum SR1.6/6 TaxID=908290 RepID=A0A6B9FT48_9HYPH|nr:HepT-like ribonuclease domain-containing protein [Methylobacterium mesophilicum]QGY05761.1 DUF86 domain-containing protein [Methylobacterium mesophilicum SR1.6/6]